MKMPWNAMNRMIVLSCLLLIAGCAGTSKPTSFFVLSTESVADVSPVISDVSNLSIGLGPIEIPDILDRPQIVTRPADNRLELAEFNRWGGELRGNIYRVMEQNLMHLLKTERVASYPWPSHRQPDYQVIIDIIRFDGRLGNLVVLEGIWALLDSDGKSEILTRQFRFEELADGSDYESFVAAQSRAVTRLSEVIARAIALQVKNQGTSG